MDARGAAHCTALQRNGVNYLKNVGLYEWYTGYTQYLFSQRLLLLVFNINYYIDNTGLTAVASRIVGRIAGAGSELQAGVERCGSTSCLGSK
jgi:hypothetical protein